MTLTAIRKKATLGFLIAVIVLLPAIPTNAANWFEPEPNPLLPQCDPGTEDYVLDTLTLGPDSMDVLVTKTANGHFAAGKEYWAVNRPMLAALGRATNGTKMTLAGSSRRWPAPERFFPQMRMQNPVTWSRTPAPGGELWVYYSTAPDMYIGIRFTMTGQGGDAVIRSMSWYLSAMSAPGSGTFVFAPGSTYELTYQATPELPRGQSWYAVTVAAGS